MSKYEALSRIVTISIISEDFVIKSRIDEGNKGLDALTSNFHSVQKEVNQPQSRRLTR